MMEVKGKAIFRFLQGVSLSLNLVGESLSSVDLGLFSGWSTMREVEMK